MILKRLPAVSLLFVVMSPAQEIRRVTAEPEAPRVRGGLQADVSQARFDFQQQVLAHQIGEHVWSKRFGGPGDDYGSAIALDSSGNAVVTGRCQGRVDFGGGSLTCAGASDIFVAKYSGTDGAHLWSKRFGGGGISIPHGIALDSSGNAVVTGEFQGTADFGGGTLASAGGPDIFVAKYSGTTGAHLWSKRFGGTGQDLGLDIALDSSGNVVVTGYFEATADFGGGALTSSGFWDMFVAKYSGADGTHLWSKRFGGTVGDLGYGVGIALDSSGNAVVTGGFLGRVDFGGGALAWESGRDMFIAKYSGTTGAHLWSKRFGSTGDQGGVDIALDSNGNVVVTGYFQGLVDFGGGARFAFREDMFVAKYSGADGAHLWSKRFGGTGEDFGSDIALDSSGNVVVTGVFEGIVDFGGGPLTSAGSKGIVVAKYSGTDGTHLWSKGFAGDFSDVALDSSGNAVMSGGFRGAADFGGGTLTSAGGFEIFVAKLALAQPAIVLSASSISFAATQAAANPASQTVSLSSSLGGPLVWTATAISSPGNWLSVSPASGAAAATLTVSANIAGLAVGTYNGTIQITSPGATNSPRTINVTLTITASGIATIGLTPASLVFAGNVGTTPPPQTFQVQNTGTGALGWTAAATTQSGGNWLSVTPATGVAPSTLTVSVSSASLAAGVYSGTVTITALASANASNSPRSIPVTLALGVPVVGNNGVVNGASFSPDAIVSPGSLVSLFGTNLAAGTEHLSGFPIPTTLSGTQVLVNGTPAPLFFVSPRQINFQMPAGLTGPTVQVVAISGGARGPAATVRIAAEVPGIFTAVPGGTGPGAVLNQDGSLNTPENPAAAASMIQIFTTGLGATNPPLATGEPGASVPPLNQTLIAPIVQIGGSSAEVSFSGVAPGFVGLYQVNVRVPPATVVGNAVTLQIHMGSQASNSVTIAVR